MKNEVLLIEPRHKGLLSSCYVDEYGNWTKDELMSIAKYWMTIKIVSLEEIYKEFFILINMF